MGRGRVRGAAAVLACGDPAPGEAVRDGPVAVAAAAIAARLPEAERPAVAGGGGAIARKAGAVRDGRRALGSADRRPEVPAVPTPRPPAPDAPPPGGEPPRRGRDPRGYPLRAARRPLRLRARARAILAARGPQAPRRRRPDRRGPADAAVGELDRARLHRRGPPGRRAAPRGLAALRRVPGLRVRILRRLRPLPGSGLPEHAGRAGGAAPGGGRVEGPRGRRPVREGWRPAEWLPAAGMGGGDPGRARTGHRGHRRRATRKGRPPRRRRAAGRACAPAGARTDARLHTRGRTPDRPDVLPPPARGHRRRRAGGSAAEGAAFIMPGHRRPAEATGCRRRRHDARPAAPSPRRASHAPPRAGESPSGRRRARDRRHPTHSGATSTPGRREPGGVEGGAGSPRGVPSRRDPGGHPAPPAGVGRPRDAGKEADLHGPRHVPQDGNREGRRAATKRRCELIADVLGGGFDSGGRASGSATSGGRRRGGTDEGTGIEAYRQGVAVPRNRERADDDRSGCAGSRVHAAVNAPGRLQDVVRHRGSRAGADNGAAAAPSGRGRCPEAIGLVRRRRCMPGVRRSRPVGANGRAIRCLSRPGQRTSLPREASGGRFRGTVPGPAPTPSHKGATSTGRSSPQRGRRRGRGRRIRGGIRAENCVRSAPRFPTRFRGQSQSARTRRASGRGGSAGERIRLHPEVHRPGSLIPAKTLGQPRPTSRSATPADASDVIGPGRRFMTARRPQQAAEPSAPGPRPRSLAPPLSPDEPWDGGGFTVSGGGPHRGTSASKSAGRNECRTGLCRGSAEPLGRPPISHTSTRRWSFEKAHSSTTRRRTRRTPRVRVGRPGDGRRGSETMWLR